MGRMVLEDGYKLLPSGIGIGEDGRRVLRLVVPSMMETARLKGFEVRNSLWTWGEDEGAVRVVTAAGGGKKEGKQEGQKRGQKRRHGGKKKGGAASFAFEKPCKDAFGQPSPLPPSLDKYWHQRSRLFSSPDACVTPLGGGELAEPPMSVAFDVPEESVAER